MSIKKRLTFFDKHVNVRNAHLKLYFQQLTILVI